MPALPKSLVDAPSSRDVIPFVGAGVSLAVTDAAGTPLFPSWSDLLKRAAERLRADHKDTKADAVVALVADNDSAVSAPRT